MKKNTSAWLVTLVIGVVAAGCKSSTTESSTNTTGIPDSADIADVSLLLQDSDDTTGAGQIGQPAELLAAARSELKRAGEIPKAVLRFLGDVREAAKTTKPVRSGASKAGPKFAIWETSKDGTELRLSVVRVNDRRVRYLLSARKDKGKAYLPLLTGLFVKGEGELRGGRFHLNLTRASEAIGLADGYSGIVHFSFAARGDTALARRVHYRDVRAGLEPSGTPARNYAVDLVRKFGVGGRARFVSIGDFVPEQAGPELGAVRVLWKAGAGGRADAVLLPLGKAGKALHASECWDKDGLRTGYLDDFADNDKANPNAGDVTNCLHLARDLPADTAPSDNGVDADPEVTSELAAAGADITESDADAASGDDL